MVAADTSDISKPVVARDANTAQIVGRTGRCSSRAARGMFAAGWRFCFMRN